MTGISLLLLLILTGLLWKVHDAYYLKTELKYIAITCIVLALPGFVLSSAGPLPSLGIALRIAFFLIIQIPCYILPIVKSFSKDSSKFNSLSLTEGVSQSDIEMADSSKPQPELTRTLFSNYPAVRDFLAKGEIGQEYLHSYIAHVQHVDASKMMLFLRKCFAIRAETQTVRVLGKATLLFQEFLQEGAYLSIRHLFAQPALDKAWQQIESFLKQMEEPDRNSFTFNAATICSQFDPFIDEAERRLFVQIFEPFFKSHFYELYQKKGALNVGIQMNKYSA